jgi:uncharacterized protein (TIGR03086 family)
MTTPGAIDLFEQASAAFGQRVATIGRDDWNHSTPCAEWDVRRLVNHLVYENRWAVPLIAGQTVAQVGDQFEGDLLGADPLGSWAEAVAASRQAIAAPGVAARTVHVSFGDISGDDYVAQLVIDHTVHAWDLARSIGADEHLDPALVDFALERVGPQAEDWRAAGAFGAKVEAALGADTQAQLLALTGRLI